ncbi:peptidylprolyl isomerase [Luminiphilus sp.]|nr:peptidylprolyl isomerase [Luminiphilus sp.]
MKSCCQRADTLVFFLLVCSSLGLTQLVVHSSSANGADSVYYSTDDFEITEFDRRMYLRNAPDATDEHVGSRIRNLQALSDLYAMEVLMSDADDLSLLPKTERDWIARHAVQLETLKRYMQFEVDRQLRLTDWDAEAMEAYQASPDYYQIQETVSVRTLLIRRDERSEDEALSLAHELLAQARLPGANFEELVRMNTEDEAAIATGGLMENVARGQTVEPFQRAAFALREEGEFSEPVVSRFGVHLIQLLDHQLPRQKSFEEAKQGIIDELKPARAAQYRHGVQAEARERKPAGFIEHTEALDALMLRTSDGKLGLENKLP